MAKSLRSRPIGDTWRFGTRQMANLFFDSMMALTSIRWRLRPTQDLPHAEATADRFTFLTSQKELRCANSPISRETSLPWLLRQTDELSLPKTDLICGFGM